jgi:hypothetical protein
MPQLNPKTNPIIKIIEAKDFFMITSGLKFGETENLCNIKKIAAFVNAQKSKNLLASI